MSEDNNSMISSSSDNDNDSNNSPHNNNNNGINNVSTNNDNTNNDNSNDAHSSSKETPAPFHSENANTIKAYGYKQEEFKKWCSDNQHDTNVSEDRLMSFLETVVIPRGSLRHSNNDTVVPIGRETVDSYIKAMVDLWRTQQTTGGNEEPHPRGARTRALLESISDNKPKRKRQKTKSGIDQQTQTEDNLNDLVNKMNANIQSFSSAFGALQHDVNFIKSQFQSVFQTPLYLSAQFMRNPFIEQQQQQQQQQHHPIYTTSTAPPHLSHPPPPPPQQQPQQPQQHSSSTSVQIPHQYIQALQPVQTSVASASNQPTISQSAMSNKSPPTQITPKSQVQQQQKPSAASSQMNRQAQAYQLAQASSLSNSVHLAQQQQQPVTTTPSSSSSSLSLAYSTPKPPVYKLNRHLQTVKQVWTEYSVGLDGGPAVEKLEQKYGTSWRKDRSESKYFSRRKAIYDEVKDIVEKEKISFDEAVTKLEKKRLESGKSLDRLSALLRLNKREMLLAEANRIGMD